MGAWEPADQECVCEDIPGRSGQDSAGWGRVTLSMCVGSREVFGTWVGQQGRDRGVEIWLRSLPRGLRHWNTWSPVTGAFWRGMCRCGLAGGSVLLGRVSTYSLHSASCLPWNMQSLSFLFLPCLCPQTRNSSSTNQNKFSSLLCLKVIAFLSKQKRNTVQEGLHSSWTRKSTFFLLRTLDFLDLGSLTADGESWVFGLQKADGSYFNHMNQLFTF